MGLPDSYKWPANTNEALGLMGDGVVAPVVRHLAANILEPILQASASAITSTRATAGRLAEIEG
jgi:DNA (cytosine-5)-methyltransferase 1